MDSDAYDGALGMFDAFMRFAREAEVHALRSMQQAARRGPVPAKVDHEDDDPSDLEVTHVAAAPLAPKDKTSAQVASVPPWEDPTHERPDVVRAMVSHPEARRTPPKPQPEQSIIVDDETLTDPEFERSALFGAVDLRATGRIPVEQFVQEMSVLIKYGHTAQAAEETERWVASHPDDLAAQIQITEFQLARLDRNAAIDRFVALVGRMIERGERVQAGDLVNRLRRDAPGDQRVGALASQMGRT